MPYKIINTIILLLFINLGNILSQRFPQLELYDDRLNLLKIELQKFSTREIQSSGKVQMLDERLSKSMKIFENGKLINEINDNGYDIDSIIYYYDENTLIKAEYYNNLKSKTPHKYRWKQFFYKDDKIFAENTFNGYNDIITSAYYKHLDSNSGSRIILGKFTYHINKYKNTDAYFEFDNQDNLIEFTEVVDKDTITSEKLLEMNNDFDFVYKYIYNGFGDEEYAINPMDVKTNKLRKLDENQLPIEYISNSIVDFRKDEELESRKETIKIENHYTNGNITGELVKAQNKNIHGEFYNDRYNLILILGLDGTCVVEKYDNTIDRVENKHIEKYWHKISEQNDCLYDIDKNIVSFSDSSVEEIEIELSFKYLTLKKSNNTNRSQYQSKIHLKQK